MPAGSRDTCTAEIRSLVEAVDTLDRRALDVIGEAMRGSVPSEDVAAELHYLSKDLKRHYARVVEVAERRDLGFADAEQLRELDQHCLWLFRKIQLERVFARKFDLEARLRKMIAKEAFQLYQALLEAEDEERVWLARDAVDLRGHLLAHGAGGAPPGSAGGVADASGLRHRHPVDSSPLSARPDRLPD